MRTVRRQEITHVRVLVVASVVLLSTLQEQWKFPLLSPWVPVNVLVTALLAMNRLFTRCTVTLIFPWTSGLLSPLTTWPSEWERSVLPRAEISPLANSSF